MVDLMTFDPGWSTGWFRSGTEASVDDGSTVVSETASVPAAGVNTSRKATASCST